MAYLVMECHPSYTIVPDDEDRVIKAANMSYQGDQVVGEVITQQIPKVSILFRLILLAAVACLRLAVLRDGACGAYGMPYGITEVRTNPDVKMSVSYMGRIIGLEDVSEDGEKLIDQVSYKGKNSKYTTGILVERTMKTGYPIEGGTIYVAAPGGNERWRVKRADVMHTGLDTLLEDGMSVGVYVEGIGKDSPPVTAPHHKGEVSGETGGDKPTFIGMSPGGMEEDIDGNGEDDRDENERGSDTENDDEKNDTDPDKCDEDNGDDREEDAGKDKVGDRDDGRDDDDKNDMNNRDDDIKRARDKSGRNNVVRQSNGADDDKDLDSLDERGNGKVGNGLNDNRSRNEDNNGEHSDQDDSDEGDSDGDDIDEDDSQEEDNDGYEDGEDDKDEDEDNDD